MCLALVAGFLTLKLMNDVEMKLRSGELK